MLYFIKEIKKQFNFNQFLKYTIYNFKIFKIFKYLYNFEKDKKYLEGNGSPDSHGAPPLL